jgi:hypothetical protein
MEIQISLKKAAVKCSLSSNHRNVVACGDLMIPSGSQKVCFANRKMATYPLTHLPADYQPLNRLYSHLATYITTHHTYFTGCETKNTAHAGCSKGNVNTPLSLIYQTKRRYFSTDHESLLRVSLRSLPPKSKTTSNHQILIFRKHSLS